MQDTYFKFLIILGLEKKIKLLKGQRYKFFYIEDSGMYGKKFRINDIFKGVSVLNMEQINIGSLEENHN